MPHVQGDVSELAAAALRGLGRVPGHPGAAAALRSALRAPDAARRTAAVDGLTGHPDADTVGALEWTAGADEDAAVALAAVDALGTLGRRSDSTGAAAVAALTSLTAEPRRREAAIAALARLPEARIAGVAAGLEDGRGVVRCAIVAALGRMRQPEASAAIRGALDDPLPEVREAAVTALDQLGARGLSRKFTAMAQADQSRAVRRAAADARGRQGAPRD
jgi:HEAT repeat protein